MKAQLLSDIHLEFLPIEEHEEFVIDCLQDVDLVILAGDITSYTFLLHDLRLFCDHYPKVLYVTGNHEYYNSSFGEVHKKLLKLSAERDNFHWLSNSICEIDGQKFVGGTLWFEENAESKDRVFQRYLNDFRLIKDLVPDCFSWHDTCVDVIKKHAREDTVVVTHHLPHENSVPARFKKSTLNCFFVTDLTDVIDLCRPKLWIHGHTHDSCDYMLGKTRVLCNPGGYPGHGTGKNLAFKKDLIIEV